MVHLVLFCFPFVSLCCCWFWNVCLLCWAQRFLWRWTCFTTFGISDGFWFQFPISFSWVCVDMEIKTWDVLCMLPGEWSMFVYLSYIFGVSMMCLYMLFSSSCMIYSILIYNPSNIWSHSLDVGLACFYSLLILKHSILHSLDVALICLFSFWSEEKHDVLWFYCLSWL